jgi:putative membrane protein
MQFSKKNISLFLAILFHLSGLVGILQTPYKDWFIRNTAFNLCLMSVLLIWNQPLQNRKFFLFFIIAFVTGMSVEWIGVHTGRLFGNYKYGSILGPGFDGVPWLIGLNWFVVVFCSGSVMEQMQQAFRRRVERKGAEMPAKIAALSLIIDGALLAVFFDWIMEPVAMKLGFWHWQNNEVPFYNYLCWFCISCLLLMVYRALPFQKPNYFAVHLLIIQVLFFWVLRLYL